MRRPDSLAILFIACLGCGEVEDRPRIGSAPPPGTAEVAVAEPRLRRRPEPAGRLDDLPPHLRRAFDTTGWAPLPSPGPDDWLSVQSEPGQTYDEFVAAGPNLPSEGRRRL